MTSISATKKYQLENYKKFLLSRVTSSQHIIDYIESCLASEDEAAPHTFHKIMVHNWNGNDIELFETLSDYFLPSFVPVIYMSQDRITSFYTSSLSLILKIVKLDFMFPHQRNMFNIDILFNDKTSADCFENRVTIENIVAGIVSCRFNEKFELDLSDFCNDPEFYLKKIEFYKLSLLTQYKILMIRMGRDTKILNLSKNNLTQAPVDILNFFIKGDLIAINLSDNNIPSMSELQRISSKIEKLWIEGNPLCEDIDPFSYVKQILMRFPRLTELDGLRINEHGIIIPFYKNYLETPDKRTKMLVEKFLCLYFAHYDTDRRKVGKFYGNKAKLSITINTTDEKQLGHNYTRRNRNMLKSKINPPKNMSKLLYSNRSIIVDVLALLPESTHDPSSFTVDVLKHDKRHLIIVVDGIYKENTNNQKSTEIFFQFRRTFVFNITGRTATISQYFISNEMFNIAFATKEQIENSFKNCANPTNPLALRNPDEDDIETICSIFSHITECKRQEAELRLKRNGWDLKKAVNEYIHEIRRRTKKISPIRFHADDDFSDSSSLMDEVD